MSWTPLREERGYALAMNRDERRTRARGTPPTAEDLDGVPALLPRDPEAGGTWIAVNALGLSVALLNRYEDTPHDDGGTYTSRGLLVRRLASAPDPATVRTRIEALRLDDFRPFTLVTVGRDSTPHLFEWNGRELDCGEVMEPGLVRASSGSDQARAEQVRGDLLRDALTSNGRLTPELLEALHRSHRPESGPLSICMHRKEAQTVSLSLVTVSLNAIRLRYVDGPPGETPGHIDLTL